MYIPGVLLLFCYSVNAASYQNYDSTNSYQYSTIPNLNGQYPYKNYGNGGSRYPESTRYPNYNPGGYASTNTGYNSYSSYSTPNSRYPGSNPYYGGANSGYTTPRYGETYRGNTGYTSYEVPFMRNIRDHCVNRSPQLDILVDNLMGMWYGVELVQHLGGDVGINQYDYYERTCIVVHISEPRDRPSTENQVYHVQHLNAKFHQEYRHLRLLWDEAGKNSEYALFFRNDSAGYWQVADAQNGTLTTRPNYQQFSGSVQVLKAVNDHLVLSFCQEPRNGRTTQLYTVLLSRNPGTMTRWERESVHNMLTAKQLSVASIRMVCGNSATRAISSIVSSILTVFLACLAFGSS